MEREVTTKTTARLLVCERTGCWAVALRRELAEAGVRVWETRTLEGCRDELAASPASFAVVELRNDVQRLLAFTVAMTQERPAARLAIVADRRWAGYESLFREAGAVHFLDSPRGVTTLAKLVCRHLAQMPPPQQDFTARIWSSLPWGIGRE
jgi:ActR/RegA family two-component response regulator